MWPGCGYEKLGGASFPGRNAGASLKQGRDLQARIGFFERFPGRNAGASLKPAQTVDYVKDLTVSFPGRNAGASLKLLDEVHKLTEQGAFPWQKCRGLIEASARAIGRAAIGVFPWQKCRGLIEATF